MTIKKQRYNLIRKIKRLKKNKDVTVVFVCGYGGAGKTTFCKNLVSKLGCDAVVFETDWFSKYATIIRRARIRTALESGDGKKIIEEENPKNWYDWILLVTSLKNLIEERHIELETAWSQETGNKDLSVQLTLPKEKGSVIICDGIYLLHDSVREFADHIVLLDVPISHCVKQMEKRDAHRSSKAYLDYKIALLHRYDKPYFDQFKHHADSVIEMPVDQLETTNSLRHTEVL